MVSLDDVTIGNKAPVTSINEEKMTRRIPQMKKKK